MDYGEGKEPCIQPLWGQHKPKDIPSQGCDVGKAGIPRAGWDKNMVVVKAHHGGDCESQEHPLSVLPNTEHNQTAPELLQQEV